MTAKTLTMTLPGGMLKRGFWLYVWRVTTPKGVMLYVGRTGDNSSPHATAPYTRMGQHLGFIKTSNALRSRLLDKGVTAEDCERFDLIAHGPIYPEVLRDRNANRATLMNDHIPRRNLVGAMEKALADELAAGGYTVLNTVKWKHDHDPKVWAAVKDAFRSHFSEDRQGVALCNLKRI
ncbi:hypothetical protein [Tardiphaga sp. 813_E8_N1_3]|uniref:hypothetical protein n=1 Tax=Tardiphaga sp. 813_E8_N1_3 TaxID=3240760 RepID=UPI003F238F05